MYVQYCAIETGRENEIPFHFPLISPTCFTQIPLRGIFVKQFSLIFSLFPWCGGNLFHSLWILFHHLGNTIHQFSPDFPQFPQNFPLISPEFPPNFPRIPPKFTNFPWISPQFPRNSAVFPEFPQNFIQSPNDSYWFLLIPQTPVQFSLQKCSLQRLWALGLFYEYCI